MLKIGLSRLVMFSIDRALIQYFNTNRYRLLLFYVFGRTYNSLMQQPPTMPAISALRSSATMACWLVVHSLSCCYCYCYCYYFL